MDYLQFKRILLESDLNKIGPIIREKTTSMFTDLNTALSKIDYSVMDFVSQIDKEIKDSLEEIKSLQTKFELIPVPHISTYQLDQKALKEYTQESENKHLFTKRKWRNGYKSERGYDIYSVPHEINIIRILLCFRINIRALKSAFCLIEQKSTDEAVRNRLMAEHFRNLLGIQPGTPHPIYNHISLETYSGIGVYQSLIAYHSSSKKKKTLYQRLKIAFEIEDLIGKDCCLESVFYKRIK